MGRRSGCGAGNVPVPTGRPPRAQAPQTAAKFISTPAKLWRPWASSAAIDSRVPGLSVQPTLLQLAARNLISPFRPIQRISARIFWPTTLSIENFVALSLSRFLALSPISTPSSLWRPPPPSPRREKFYLQKLPESRQNYRSLGAAWATERTSTQPRRIGSTTTICSNHVYITITSPPSPFHRLRTLTSILAPADVVLWLWPRLCCSCVVRNGGTSDTL